MASAHTSNSYIIAYVDDVNDDVEKVFWWK
jgi:hypothetical protein